MKGRSRGHPSVLTKGGLVLSWNTPINQATQWSKATRLHVDMTGYQDGLLSLLSIKGSNSVHEEGHPQSSQRDCSRLTSMLT